MTINPETFQTEVMKWTLYNFPTTGQNKHWPLLGVVEEIGELVESLHNLGVKDADSNTAKIRDAIGDTMIFLASFCGMNGMNLYMCAEKWTDYCEPMTVIYTDFPFELSILSGRLCHAFLKNDQGIRGHGHSDAMRENVGKICSVLACIAGQFGTDILSCIDEAWEQVSKRDWIKFPKNGVSLEDRPKRTTPEGVRVPQTPGKFKLVINPKLNHESKDTIAKADWNKEVPF